MVAKTPLTSKPVHYFRRYRQSKLDVKFVTDTRNGTEERRNGHPLVLYRIMYSILLFYNVVHWILECVSSNHLSHLQIVEHSDVTHKILLYFMSLQYSLLHCNALYSNALYCNALDCISVLCCTVLYCTVRHCTVLYCNVRYCTVLYCTVLYLWIVLYYVIPYYTVL